MTGALRAVAAVGLVASLAACGIGTDARPHVLDPAGLPPGLASPGPAATASSTTTEPTANQVLVHVFLVAPDGHLVSADRLMSLPLGAGLDAVLDALFAGPTAAEAARGLQTAIPAQTKVLSTSVAGGVATVNLDSSLNQLVGPAQVEAVAQVVYTATAQPGVVAVVFEFSGQQAEVPVQTGPPAAIVGRPQYPSLAPLGS